MLEELHIADYAVDADTHVIEVGGQVDLYSAPDLKRRTSSVIDAGVRCVIMDLSRVTFMDSTGLGILIGARKRLRRSGAEVVLVITNYDVEHLLEITGLDGTFATYRSVEEAIARK